MKFFILFVCVLALTLNSLDAYSSSNPDSIELEANLSESVANSASGRRHRRFIILSSKSQTSNDSDECGNSSEDFPSIFTEQQVENGAIIAVCIIGIYCFTLLAIICDKYFLPCVERICEALNLSHDVAAATFMSVATSAPELFVNIIGTFITESDIGIGTVVGSSLFNTLGVASLGGLAASKSVQLDWWPVTRDVIIYICAILLLVAITWDEKIFWYEGLILFIVYFLYFTIMFQNVRIATFIKRIFSRCRTNKVSDCEKAVTEPTVNVISSSYGSYSEEPVSRYTENKEQTITEKKQPIDEDADEPNSLYTWPKGTFLKRALFVYTWPIKFLLHYTVPDPQKHPKLFPITFVCCIVLIGLNSYLVSWMISIIGQMFNIPDAVLGLTFLAAGGCLPEAISITIMSRRGEGSMGVSNSLGANTMNILLSLGMPWFIKTLILNHKDGSPIKINSGSIEYTIFALIPIALILYITLYFNKFRLCRRVGCILLSTYVVCIVLAILAEMVFFHSDCTE